MIIIISIVEDWIPSWKEYKVHANFGQSLDASNQANNLQIDFQGNNSNILNS